MTTRVWGGLVLETRVEYGYAARRNRGRYAGQAIHRLICEYIVAIEEGHVPPAGTLGSQFVRYGKPVLFSSYPSCGCCGGQRAGSPVVGKTEADISCQKCKGRV